MTNIPHTNMRNTIIYELSLMAKKESINKNFFKVNAYNKVIDQLKYLHSIYDINDIIGIDGIGRNIREKIIEILNTGKLSATDALKPKYKLYNILLKVYGIGPNKAHELIQSGITSLNDLRNKSFLLNKNQQMGVYYYNDLLKKIPRNEISEHYKYLNSILAKFNCFNLHYQITGSYLRGSDFSGDIDLLISSHKAMNTLIKYLTNDGYIQFTLASGPRKYMGIVKLKDHNINRRLDIIATTHDEYPFSLLYFTGNKNLNIKLRQKAHDLGFKLNEKSLTNIQSGQKLLLHSEKEIFNFLGFEYKKPTDRNNTILVQLK